jgi:hypothetical protein
MTERYYSISKGIAIIPQNNSNILLRSDNLSIMLEGKSAEFFTTKIFPNLTGEISFIELMRIVDIPEKELLIHMDKLVELGVLKLKSYPHKSNTSNFENILDDLNLDKTEVSEILKNVVIGILGLEGEGVLLATSLLNSGFKNFFFIDPFPVEVEHTSLLQIYHNKDIGISKEEVARKFFLSEYDNCKISIFEKPITKDLVFEAVDKCDMLVCCFDREFISANYWVNKACIAKNKPVIFSEIKGHLCKVGPFVRNYQI